VSFGHHPRSYRQAMPKKMRRQALRCMLSSKVAEDRLIVLDKLEFSQPRTKEMVSILERLGVNSSAVIVTSERDDSVVKSCCNLQGVEVIPASLVSVIAILSSSFLIMTLPAVRLVERLWEPRKLITNADEV